jgi:enoyl-CoA hydratase
MTMFRIDPGPVTVVTLDRPPANALTGEMLAEFTELLGRFATPAVRAVVVTGNGRCFSAGLDLHDVFDADDAGFAAFTERFDAALAAFFAFPKPVVAAVNGHAIAGGAVLAAGADFRLMADGEGRAGLTEIQVGIPFPTSALEIVRFACAGPHLPELLYLGNTYRPADACARRLVDEVVPAADLLPRARALAEELGAREPAAFAATKRALRADALARIEAARAGGDPVWRAWRTPAARAAVEAFRRRTIAKGRA